MTGRLKKNPRKMPIQRRAKLTVDAILSASAQVIDRVGYARASTNRIAERAGVAIASLYQYFPNKESIVAMVIDQRLQQHIALFSRIVEECRGESADKLADAIATEFLWALVTEASLLRKMLPATVMIDQMDSVVAAQGRAADLLAADLIRRGACPDKRQATVRAFVTLHSLQGLLCGYVHGNMAGLTRGEFLSEARRLARASLTAAGADRVDETEFRELYVGAANQPVPHSLV